LQAPHPAGEFFALRFTRFYPDVNPLLTCLNAFSRWMRFPSCRLKGREAGQRPIKTTVPLSPGLEKAHRWCIDIAGDQL
jgi:hypothetical protein